MGGDISCALRVFEETTVDLHELRALSQNGNMEAKMWLTAMQRALPQPCTLPGLLRWAMDASSIKKTGLANLAKQLVWRVGEAFDREVKEIYLDGAPAGSILDVLDDERTIRAVRQANAAYVDMVKADVDERFDSFLSGTYDKAIVYGVHVMDSAFALDSNLAFYGVPQDLG